MIACSMLIPISMVYTLVSTASTVVLVLKNNVMASECAAQGNCWYGKLTGFAA